MHYIIAANSNTPSPMTTHLSDVFWGVIMAVLGAGIIGLVTQVIAAYQKNTLQEQQLQHMKECQARLEKTITEIDKELQQLARDMEKATVRLQVVNEKFAAIVSRTAILEKEIAIIRKRLTS